MLHSRWSGLALALLCSGGVARPQGAPAPKERPSGVLRHAERASDGYTLFSPLGTRLAVLIDMNGREVHRWTTDSPPAGAVRLLDNGRLLRAAIEPGPGFATGGGRGGRIQELTWDGEVTWDYVLADENRRLHHDLHPMPNGNVLAIAWERIGAQEAALKGRDPERFGNAELWSDVVLEIRPARPIGGEVVWEWRAWDHVATGGERCSSERLDVNADGRPRLPSREEADRLLEIEADMRKLGYVGGGEATSDPGDPPRAGNAADWMHTNGIDYLPSEDLIVLSARHLCEVLVIDHGTTTEEAAGWTGGRRGRGGDVLYRWGNPTNYGCGSEDDRRLHGQHDPTWLEGEEGELRLLVFDNGWGRGDQEFSEVLELVLPFDPERGFLRLEDQPFGPREPVWRYKDPGDLFSAFLSGAQRLPGGNTLICAGPQAHLLEVTPDGEVVWDYWSPFLGPKPPPPGAGGPPRFGAGGRLLPWDPDAAPPPGALFQAQRIPRDHPGLEGKGLP